MKYTGPVYPIPARTQEQTRLVIELKVIEVDRSGIGITTYHDGARVLTRLAKDWRGEAPGAELAHEYGMRQLGRGRVYDRENGTGQVVIVGDWRIEK